MPFTINGSSCEIACIFKARKEERLYCLYPRTWFIAILTFLYEISLYEMNLPLYGQPSQLILTMLNLFVVLLSWGFMYFFRYECSACMYVCMLGHQNSL